MPADASPFDLRPLPAMRIAAASEIVPAAEATGVAKALFQEVQAVFGHAPGAQDVPIATYAVEGDRMRIAAGYLVGMLVPEGLEAVELAAEEQVATLEHRGPMSGVQATWDALRAAVAERGLAPTGVARERYVRAVSADQTDWIVELQQPVRRA